MEDRHHDRDVFDTFLEELEASEQYQAEKNERLVTVMRDVSRGLAQYRLLPYSRITEEQYLAEVEDVTTDYYNLWTENATHPELNMAELWDYARETAQRDLGYTYQQENALFVEICNIFDDLERFPSEDQAKAHAVKQDYLIHLMADFEYSHDDNLVIFLNRELPGGFVECDSEEVQFLVGSTRDAKYDQSGPLRDDNIIVSELAYDVFRLAQRDGEEARLIASTAVTESILHSQPTERVAAITAALEPFDLSPALIDGLVILLEKRYPTSDVNEISY